MMRPYQKVPATSIPKKGMFLTGRTVVGVEGIGNDYASGNGDFGVDQLYCRRTGSPAFPGRQKALVGEEMFPVQFRNNQPFWRHSRLDAVLE